MNYLNRGNKYYRGFGGVDRRDFERGLIRGLSYGSWPIIIFINKTGCPNHLPVA